MSMLRSRAGLTERRTAQFLVERMCPVSVERGQVTKQRAERVTFPLVVWVRLDRAPASGGAYKCGARHYLVDYEEAKAHRAAAGLDTVFDCRVCEHMGRLIE